MGGGWDKIKQLSKKNIGSGYSGSYFPTFGKYGPQIAAGSWSGVKKGAGLMTGLAAGAFAATISGGGWLVFAFLLFISDTGFFNFFPITQFNVLDPKWFWLRGTSTLFLDIFLNGIVLTVVAIYTVANIGHLNKRDIITKWLIAAFFMFIFNYAGTIGSMIHLIFAFMFWLSVLRPLYGEDADIILLVFMAIDFFGVSFFAVIGNLSKGVKGFVIVENLVFFPIWLLFIAFNPRLKNPPVLKWLSVGFILFILIFNLGFRYQDVKGLIGGAARPTEEVKSKWDRSWDNFWLTLEDAKKATERALKRQLEYATGGYYEGQVEENEHEQLGVYLENIEKVETEFYEDEPVTIWVTLKARTLEKDKEIKINVSCFEGDEDDKIIGEVTPKEEFVVYTLEEEDILCRFGARKLEYGSRKAKIFAEFNFPTMAYLKTYFIDKARMRAMNREGIDVFEFFGISDAEPIAVYTNGPVKIGMETSTPPIGISQDYDSKPRLGITIENQWDGEIEGINDLTIYAPQGIEIDASTCNYPFLEESDVNKYSNEGFAAYKLSDVGKKFEKFKNIEDFVSIRCLLDIKKENANEILGDTPFATKYFRLTVDYQYKLKKEIDVDIKKAEGFNVYFSEEKPTSGTKDLKCVGEHSKKNLKKASYEFYSNGAKKYDGNFACSGRRCERKVPIDIIKRGESIKCVMTATDKDEGNFSDAAVAEIGNSKPSIKVQLPDTASLNEDLICNGTYEDRDNDQPYALDGEAQSVNYEFSEGYFGDGKAKCEAKNNKWECKATAPKEELSVGETIACKMIPNDGAEIGDSSEDSVIISAPVASSGGVT